MDFTIPEKTQTICDKMDDFVQKEWYPLEALLDNDRKTFETTLCLFFSDECGARIYDGADEMHKLSVTKQILKAYRTE